MIKNFTIFGYGKHFKKKVLHSLNKFTKVNIVNIVSRTKKKDKNFNIVKKINTNTSSNFIYIATPIGIHKKNILDALQFKNTKLIICEKSITNNLEHTIDVVKKAKLKKIPLIESFMFQYHPQFIELKKIITNITKNNNSGTIFCRYTIPKLTKNDHRNNNKLSGGILYDIGCYPISVLFLLFNINKKKLNQIKIKRIFNSNNKSLISFNFKKLNFIISWGYNSNYRNKFIFYNKNNKITADKIFGKYNNDIVSIKKLNLNNNNLKEYKFKDGDNFYHMFNFIFKSLNNKIIYKKYYNEIIQIAELNNYFKKLTNPRTY